MGDLVPIETNNATDMELTVPANNRKETLKFLEGQPHTLELPGFSAPPGYQLLESRKETHSECELKVIALVYTGSQVSWECISCPQDLDELEIVYKVKVIKAQCLPIGYDVSNGSNVLVWKQPAGHHSAATNGLGRLMINYLLGIYTIVLTNEQQTEDNKRFWFDRMGELLSTKACSIYYSDLGDTFADSLKARVFKVSTFEHLFEYFIPLGWGDTKELEKRVFILSKTDTTYGKNHYAELTR